MLQQEPMSRAEKQLKDTTASILQANGYRIVTDDQGLFPIMRPDLAAEKNGQLIVFAVKSFRRIGQFMRPEHLNDIREELENVVNRNNLSMGHEIKKIQSVAIVMTPESITVASEAGDIQWLVIRDFDELPDQLDRVIA